MVRQYQAIIKVDDFVRSVQRHPKISLSSHTPVSVETASRKEGGGGSPKALDDEEGAVGVSRAPSCSCLGATSLLDRLKEIGLTLTASSAA